MSAGDKVKCCECYSSEMWQEKFVLYHIFTVKQDGYLRINECGHDFDRSLRLEASTCLILLMYLIYCGYSNLGCSIDFYTEYLREEPILVSLLSNLYRTSIFKCVALVLSLRFTPFMRFKYSSDNYFCISNFYK